MRKPQMIRMCVEFTVTYYSYKSLEIFRGCSDIYPTRCNVPSPPQVPDAVDTVVCAPDGGWRYHPKHVERFPEINKLCNVASCCIYIRTSPKHC